MNNFCLVGRLHEEPEKLTSSNGLNYVKLVVNTDPLNKEDKPELFEVVAFRSLAESSYYKDQIVAISGRLVSNNYEKEGSYKFNASLIANVITVIA